MGSSLTVEGTETGLFSGVDDAAELLPVLDAAGKVGVLNTDSL